MTVSNEIIIDPEILGGTPVFKGTRVPIKVLMDYLEAGDGLEIFLDHFPTVSRERAVTFLQLTRAYFLTRLDVSTAALAF